MDAQARADAAEQGQDNMITPRRCGVKPPRKARIKSQGNLRRAVASAVKAWEIKKGRRLKDWDRYYYK